MKRFLEAAPFVICLAATIGIAATSVCVIVDNDDQQIIDALRAERDEARAAVMSLQAENAILRQIIDNEVDAICQKQR